LVRVYVPAILPAIMVVVTSFGYHIIIPSLVTYLHRDLKKIRTCLVFGALIPFLAYITWEVVMLGAIPKDQLAHSALSLTGILKGLTNRPGIGTTTGLFSFFAITTSFLGVSLSLSDFLRDGLKIKPTKWGRLLVVTLTFIPPLFFAWFYPEGFIFALKYGGIAVVVLLGMLPIAMVWVDRYVKKRKHPYRVWGGRSLLSFVFVLLVAMIVLEFI